jgi:hypothetical protein
MKTILTRKKTNPEANGNVKCANKIMSVIKIVYRNPPAHTELRAIGSAVAHHAAIEHVRTLVVDKQNLQCKSAAVRGTTIVRNLYISYNTKPTK